MRRPAPFVALALAVAAVAGAAPGGGRADRGNGDVFDAFVAFGRHPTDKTWSAVPFADRVELGLASRLLVRRTAQELRDRRAWTLEVVRFRGGSGPFSALRTIAGERRRLTIGAGSHHRCASPPGPAPRRVASLARMSIEPFPVESCLQWWSVDLYLTRDNRVRAVTLDLWEP
jgi:hypothetical protein